MGYGESCRETIHEWIENYEWQGEGTPQGTCSHRLASADERTGEAEAVEPCAELLVAVEMQERRPGVGRYSPWSSYGESLGRRYHRRLARIDLDKAADLLRLTIAVGYVGALLNSPDASPGRDNEAIWKFSTVRLLGDTAEEALGKQYFENIEEEGTHRFSRSAREPGLKPRIRGRLGAHALSGLYMRAGILFRLAQSKQVSDAVLETDYLQLNNRWPLIEHADPA